MTKASTSLSMTPVSSAGSMNVSRKARLLTMALCAGVSIATLALPMFNTPVRGQAQEEGAEAPEKALEVKVAAQRPPATILAKDIRESIYPGVVGFAGMVEFKGSLEAAGKKTGAILIKENLGPGKAVEFDVAFNGPSSLTIRPGAYGDLTGASNTDKADYALVMANDLNGYSLNFTGQVYAPSTTSKIFWVNDRRRDTFQYWPSVERNQKALVEAGIEPVTINNRRMPVRVEYHKGSMRVYVDNTLAFIVQGEDFSGPMAMYLLRDTSVTGVRVVDIAEDTKWVGVPLKQLANDRFGNVKLEKDTAFKSATGVPFTLLGGGHNMLNLKPATWIDGPKNLSTYYEDYDNGAPVMNDPRMPMIRVPVADYTGAHVLAYAVDEKETTPVLTMRSGSYDNRGQTLQHDFAVRVGRQSQIAEAKGNVSETPLGKLQDVFVPFTAAFGQDLALRPVMEIELTKEVHLARRSPDPNRFRYRPIGLPSGVRIAAITLEKSPLQIKVSSGMPGNVFEQPAKPKWSIQLENITGQDQTYAITVRTRHLDGDEATVSGAQNPVLKGFVPAGKTKTVEIEPGYTKLGYYDISFDIDMPGVQRKLVRRTTFGVIPPNTRKHVAESPFGTWDFTGAHYTSNDPEVVGPLYVKAGIRYGMFSFKLEDRQKYGVLAGNEPKIVWSAPKTIVDPNDKTKKIDVPGTWTSMIDTFLAKNPDTKKKVALILHENSISGSHVQRVPDVFTDRPPYKWIPNADPKLSEQQFFEKVFTNMVEGARAVKAKYPDIHLRLGNGPLPTKEEFLRAKFPTELFDSAGNESGTFGRSPETQPPDYVGFGSSLWMDRAMLDFYGYKDKPVTQCYEICYPNTNPGNLGAEVQGDYFVRHAMHALIWGIPEIRMGCISDTGSSYRYSNWGASGLTYKMPELSIKPAYVAYSTMTRVLDGAKLPRSLETGSESVYAMEFDRPEPGTFASCVWSITGPREAVFEFVGEAPGEIVDTMGNRPEGIKIDGNKVTLTLGPRPFFMTGKSRMKSVQALAPIAPMAKPAGELQVLVASPTPATLGQFKAVEQRDAELEGYNFMTPRRKGDFELSVTKATGAIPANAAGEYAIKVTPKSLGSSKPTLAMPMYSSYALAKPVELKGQPTSIAIAVKGNSGWGRFIFELKDASGQTWRSIGASQRGELSPWLLDWMPKEMLAQKDDGTKQVGKISDWNTDDVWGFCKINFDGWKYLDVPLPGTFTGDYQMYWPSNSQWKFDKDGIVHYPLTLTGITVEIPEKVLKLNRYEPVGDASIQFGEILGVTRGERWLKPRSSSVTADEGFDRLPMEMLPRESD